MNGLFSFVKDRFYGFIALSQFIQITAVFYSRLAVRFIERQAVRVLFKRKSAPFRRLPLRAFDLQPHCGLL